LFFCVSAQPAEVIALSATGRRVLIVSASMGGGHDGAAFELARRLRTRGYDVEVRDFLQAWPRLVARIVKTSYLFQLKVAPPTYDWLYRGIELIPVVAAIARLIAGWACRRLRQWVRDDDVAVISTYPLASQALGQLKADGHIRAPLATFLTDFSVHRLWVSPYVDLHLAAHPVTAAAAERLGAGYTVVTGPVVPPRFAALPPEERAAVRARKRAELGVPADATVALLVTGSWGVGDVAHTAAGITTSGAAVPVIVCGRNTALLQRLRHRGVGVALGWVDDMPALMAASDVLVQNAGGLTCMEAFAGGLPVLSHACIPGHGVANAAAMDAAGVARWVPDSGDLPGALRACASGPLGRRLRQQGAAAFQQDPADVLDDWLTDLPVAVGDLPVAVGDLPVAVGADPTVAAARRPGSKLARRPLAHSGLVASLIGVLGLTWAATGGVAVATSHGVGVVRAPHSDSVYLVIRPSSDGPLDPGVTAELQHLNAAVAVDHTLATRQPDAVRSVVDAGLDVVNAGTAHDHGYDPAGSTRDLVSNARRLRQLTGERHRLYVADHRLDALDLGLSYFTDARIVVAGVLLDTGQAPPRLTGGDVVLIDAPARASAAVSAELDAVVGAAQAEGLRFEPVTALTATGS
jgi:processive 1,2-diacylglycerol beta-glucosyltransferase